MIQLDVVAVVVTYNRSLLLLKCLSALATQSRRPDLILIIDNASEDGTKERLQEEAWLERPFVRYLRMPQNLGGAGGFHHGVRHAMELGGQNMWLMDDDAAPEPDSLRNLLASASNVDCIYGSVAVRDGQLCWPMSIIGSTQRRTTEIADLPRTAEVDFLPFLGFLVNRTVVERIGLPDAGYFIAADDLEYSLRARRSGFKTILVGDSRIQHPQPRTYQMRVPGRVLTCLRLPPWKRYYDTRNRVLLAKSYYGIRLWTQTMPSLLARMVGTLLNEPDTIPQLWASIAGMLDGFLGLKGRRHERWGLKV
jgi:rhamnopyranosyl-N-acetylglucosaminyl-diphospho-decaprenol beta-1,3/1,4-galactofuranosyltransferase